MRPIDADKIPYSFDVVPNADPRKCYFKATADKRDIDKMPTVSPDDVRGVGEWEDAKQHGMCRCSVCKDCYIEKDYITQAKWRFCPSCGARMKGAGDEL